MIKILSRNYANQLRIKKNVFLSINATSVLQRSVFSTERQKNLYPLCASELLQKFKNTRTKKSRAISYFKPQDDSNIDYKSIIGKKKCIYPFHHLWPTEHRILYHMKNKWVTLIHLGDMRFQYLEKIDKTIIPLMKR